MMADKVEHVDGIPQRFRDEDGQSQVFAQVGARETYATIQTGELAGSATAVQMPSIVCKRVKFKAVIGNAGNVYIGGANVTIVDGATDITSGYELDAGEETPWFDVLNLNVFYRICDNAGDDLVYIALS
jgi:hypothetical protein